MSKATESATTRQFNAAVRHWRKACRELEERAGEESERIGTVLDLDAEWREMGKRMEDRLHA